MKVPKLICGKGWRALIFPPSVTRPLTDSPCNLEKSEKQEILAKAKHVIDAHLRSQARAACATFQARCTRAFLCASFIDLRMSSMPSSVILLDLHNCAIARTRVLLIWMGDDLRFYA